MSPIRTRAANEEIPQRRSSTSPSVPLAIWLCAPPPEEENFLPPLVDGVSRALIARIASEFSQPDDTVVVSGLDAPRIAAVVDSRGHRHAVIDHDRPATRRDRSTAGRSPAGPRDHAPTTRGLPPAAPHSAGLVLAVELPLPWVTPTGEPYTAWRGLLRNDGVLAVITANPAGPGRFANHTGLVIAAAEAAGFAYLQHIVAVHAHIAGDRLLVPADHAGSDPGVGGLVHVPAHSDLLVFTVGGGW